MDFHSSLTRSNTVDTNTLLSVTVSHCLGEGYHGTFRSCIKYVGGSTTHPSNTADIDNITFFLAFILSHLPGQESGRALVEVMYGEQSPSGRLPYTIAKKESDYGILLNPVLPVGVEYYTQDSEFRKLPAGKVSALNLSDRFH